MFTYYIPFLLSPLLASTSKWTSEAHNFTSNQCAFYVLRPEDLWHALCSCSAFGVEVNGENSGLRKFLSSGLVKQGAAHA